MSVRWRIARALVGPIIRDPLPGKDGCAVIIRESGATATYYPAKFRIRSRLQLRPHIYGADPDCIFGDTHRQITTFAGVFTR